MREKINLLKKEKGFTLIELLVAMAIIGLLIGMTIFGVSQALRASRDTSRQNLVKEVQTAIAVYQGRFRKFPTSSMITSTANTPVSGQSRISIGTAPNNVTLDYSLNVQITASATTACTNLTGNNYNDANDACICYNFASGQTNYSLGVKLESGEWYHITSDKCPGS